MNKQLFLKMYFKYILCLILIVQSLNSSAQLLWEISGGNLEKPSYLFGTHHVVPVSFLDSIESLYKCYNRCEASVGEVVMNEDVFQRQFQKAAIMTRSLSDILSESDYTLVDSVVHQYLNISLKSVQHLKPSVLSGMLELSFYEQITGSKETDVQMDSFFQQMAERQNHPVYGLESVEDQIELLFRTQTIERQAFLLVGTAKMLKSSEESCRILDKLYKSGDLEGLLAYSESDTSEYRMTEGENFLLIEERNRKWSEALPSLMKKHSCFISVGVLHLPGKSGLIALLKKKGYKVKPVTP